MANRSSEAGAGAQGFVRSRVYWQSDSGLEHGLIRREISQGAYEVYSYRTGELLTLKSKEIQKRIQEIA